MKSSISPVFEFKSKLNNLFRMIQTKGNKYPFLMALLILLCLSGCGVNSREWNMNALFEKSKDKFKFLGKSLDQVVEERCFNDEPN